MPGVVPSPRAIRGSYLLLALLAVFALVTRYVLRQTRVESRSRVFTGEGFDVAAAASESRARPETFSPTAETQVPLLDAPEASVPVASHIRSQTSNRPGVDPRGLDAPEIDGPRSASNPPSRSAASVPDPSEREPAANRELRETLGERGFDAVKNAADEPWLLPAIIDRLADHPRVLGALANNGLLVSAFMASPPVRRVCEDRGAMEDFLSDGKSEWGVAPLQRLLERTSRKPAAARALFASKGASTFLSRCTSILSIRMDPAPTAKVLDRNPQVVDSIGLFMEGLGVNPESKQFAQELKTLDDHLRRQISSH